MLSPTLKRVPFSLCRQYLVAFPVILCPADNVLFGEQFTVFLQCMLRPALNNVAF